MGQRHSRDDHSHAGHSRPGHPHLGHSYHGHGHHGHSQHGNGAGDKRRVLLAAALTGLFMLAEVAGGLLTGSLALLADAGHMLSDTVALLLAWYAFHLAGKAATPRLTYGFDRVKTLVAYTNGLAVFAVGLWILVEAWQRASAPSPVLGGPMLAVALLGLLVNLAAFLVLHGGDRTSLNMRGAILHVLGDLLGSVAAIAAAAVILLTGWYPIDPILSAFVALLLFRSAWALVQQSAHMLMEGTPEGLDRDRIARDLEAHVPGLAEVHHMHLWALDGARNMATLHASLREGTDAPAAIRAIKQRLAEVHRIAHATVEPEYGACADHAPSTHPPSTEPR